LRFKILGLMALVALVAAMGTIGLKSDKASAAPVQVSLLGGAGGNFTFSATFNNDETAGPIVFYVNALPVGATGVFGAAVTCSVDANGNNTIDASEIGNAVAAACVVTSNSTAGPGGVPPALPQLVVTPGAGLDTNTIENLFQISGTFSTTATIGSVITLNANEAGVIIAGAGQVAIGDPAGCSVAPDAATISVCKVDQRGTLIAATFALQGPSFLANMVTGSVAGGVGCTTASLSAGVCAVTPQPSSNPCRSTWECTRVLQNGVVSAAPRLGVVNPLPAGTYTLTEATAGGYGCTQIQITNGYGQVMPPGQPITIVLPAVDPRATSFTFTNSCLLPGGPNGTGSSIVTVIGGSTFGLTNTTNVEINPAAGSDDDARIDVRIRDANNIPIPNAHVFVMTDKGRLAVRQDLTGPTIVGYDVVEPSAPNFGLNSSGDSCDQVVASVLSPASVPQNVIPGAFSTFLNPYLGNPSQQIQDGFTNFDGILSACLFVNDSLVPGITPGKANITVITEAPNAYFGVGYLGGGAGNLVLTSVVTVVGPPASIKVSASPTTLQCGEKATITATITDAVGQNVSDHTRVELVSNFGSTIGGTGATLGFPGAGPVNPVSSSAAETFSGVATAFLLTSTEHVGPYEVVVASGGSTGGSFVGSSAYPFVTGSTPQLAGVNFPLFSAPTVVNSGGVFSTAPVSAQATVTCALPTAAIGVSPLVPPIVAPRTGEGIRPPNTGDAGLADISSTFFAD